MICMVSLKNYGPLVPLSTKPIFYVEQKPSILVKAFKDIAKMEDEVGLHERACPLVRCPKLVDCFIEDGVGYILMERIDGKSLHELYGDKASNIPADVWKAIHSIVYKLYCSDIHYVDITPYNFMIETSSQNLYVIDFGDAYLCKINWFLKEFLDGENTWNSDFE